MGGILAILSLVAQAASLAANAAVSVNKLYTLVGTIFQNMAKEGRSEPTAEELEIVRVEYNALRSDFHKDDERE